MVLETHAGKLALAKAHQKVYNDLRKEVYNVHAYHLRPCLLRAQGASHSRPLVVGGMEKMCLLPSKF